MRGLQLELLARLERDEPHRRAAPGFRDRLGIVEVVLVRLHKGLHVLRWVDPNLVPRVREDPAPMLGPAAGLHGHDRPWRRRGERTQFCAGESLLQDDGAVAVETDEVKPALAEVDADDVGLGAHLSPPPGYRPAIVGEEGQTIPLRRRDESGRVPGAAPTAQLRSRQIATERESTKPAKVDCPRLTLWLIRSGQARTARL